jgi:hypothetical protein
MPRRQVGSRRGDIVFFIRTSVRPSTLEFPDHVSSLAAHHGGTAWLPRSGMKSLVASWVREQVERVYSVCTPRTFRQTGPAETTAEDRAAGEGG